MPVTKHDYSACQWACLQVLQGEHSWAPSEAHVGHWSRAHDICRQAVVQY